MVCVTDKEHREALLNGIRVIHSFTHQSVIDLTVTGVVKPSINPLTNELLYNNKVYKSSSS